MMAKVRQTSVSIADARRMLEQANIMSVITRQHVKAMNDALHIQGKPIIM